MKKKLSEVKESFVNAVKFIVCTVVTIMGFAFIYGMIWFACGLPNADWAIWVFFIAANISARLLCWWLSN